MSVFVCKRQIWRHLHVTLLQCWTKFSNVLVYWGIRMICAKNYETVSKFVNVMPRILWPLFPVMVNMRDCWWEHPAGANNTYPYIGVMHVSTENEAKNHFCHATCTVVQENHAIAKVTARCAQYMTALKIVLSAKAADLCCARIPTLQSYHHSAVKLLWKYSNQCDHGT